MSVKVLFAGPQLLPSAGCLFIYFLFFAFLGRCRLSCQACWRLLAFQLPICIPHPPGPHLLTHHHRPPSRSPLFNFPPEALVFTSFFFFFFFSVLSLGNALALTDFLPHSGNAPSVCCSRRAWASTSQRPRHAIRNDRARGWSVFSEADPGTSRHPTL